MTHVGRIVAGVLLLAGGLILGLTSHQVNFHQAQYRSFHVISTNSGLVYFQPAGTNIFYVINPANFTPYPDPGVFDNNRVVTSLQYSDNTQNVNITMGDGTQLTGTGYTVVQFALSSGSGPGQSFAVDDYTQHPGGYYDNRWQIGGILGGVGLLFLAFTFLAPLVAARLGWGKKGDGMVAVSDDKARKLLNKQYVNPWTGRGRRIDPKDLAR